MTWDKFLSYNSQDEIFLDNDLYGQGLDFREKDMIIDGNKVWIINSIVREWEGKHLNRRIYLMYSGTPICG